MLKIIKTCYKNCDFATATYRVLRRDCGLHNRSTTQAIGKIVTKFEETGFFTSIERLCIIVSLVPLKISLS